MYQAKEEKIIKSQKGITLIALVITIIILLILAGVTLNAAIGDNGLFQRSKVATEKYQEAESNEAIDLAQIEKELKNAYIDYNEYVGYEVTEYTSNGTCTIPKETSGVEVADRASGNSIDENGSQTFTTEDLGGWKIWDYNSATGVVRLISSKPTTATLMVKGATRI